MHKALKKKAILFSLGADNTCHYLETSSKTDKNSSVLLAVFKVVGCVLCT